METKFPSPDGKYSFQIEPWEARMSLWVESPRLIEVESGVKLFDLTGTNWSLGSAEWLDGERVQLSLRHYPGDHSPSAFKVVIDSAAKQAIFNEETITLDGLEPYLETIYHQNQVRDQSSKPLSVFSWLGRLLSSVVKPQQRI